MALHSVGGKVRRTTPNNCGGLRPLLLRDHPERVLPSPGLLTDEARVPAVSLAGELAEGEHATAHATRPLVRRLNATLALASPVALASAGARVRHDRTPPSTTRSLRGSATTLDKGLRPVALASAGARVRHDRTPPSTTRSLRGSATTLDAGTLLRRALHGTARHPADVRRSNAQSNKTWLRDAGGAASGLGSGRHASRKQASTIRLRRLPPSRPVI